VGWYDWLLFLHVAAAFAAVAAVVFLFVMLAATWRTERAVEALALLRLSTVASRLWDAGGAGTLVFGVWLAIYVDGYELWDAWIIAALVLWVVAAAAGTRAAGGYRKALRARSGEGVERAGLLHSEKALAAHAVLAVAVAALLVDMIYKPGA
jgi:hypothetical protein